MKYPSEEAMNRFLVEHLNVEVTKICSVLHNRAQKSVHISFLKEGDLIKFERNLLKSLIMQFPDSGKVKICGYSHYPCAV